MIFNIRNEKLRAELEPIVSLHDGTTMAFEMLSKPLDSTVDPEVFIYALDGFSLSSLLIRQLETFQKLNEQDKSIFFSVFINLSPNLAGKWLSWEDFVPFHSQFQINVEINPHQVCNNLTKASIGLLAKLKSMGVRLWLDYVDEGKYLIPDDISNLIYGFKFDNKSIWRYLRNENRNFITHLPSIWGGSHIISKGIETECNLDISQYSGVELWRIYIENKYIQST